jgi:hypothetical protein
MRQLTAFGCSLATVAAVLAGQVFAEGRQMLIINDTEFEIVQLFGARKGLDEWGNDLLDGMPITAFAERSVDFEDGSGYCLFDIRAIFDDGEELVSEDINICDLTMFTYY